MPIEKPSGLDGRAKRFLDALNAGTLARTGPPTIAEIRTAAAELAKFAAPPPPVARRDHVLRLASRDLALRDYSPLERQDSELPGLVFFHGGGLVCGDLDTHDALCATLAHGAGCRVLAVDYRLAPEARFPAAFDDALAATLAIAGDPSYWCVDPGRLSVGGDSAGGQLAVLVAQEMTQRGVSLALQLLLCPVMDPLARAPSRHSFAQGLLIEETTMQVYWDAYRVEGLAPDDPRVAPLRANDFRSLPPALIHVAEFDPLRDEGCEYAAALVRAGVAASLTMHGALIHHFYGLGGIIPTAKSALETVALELARAFEDAAI